MTDYPVFTTKGDARAEVHEILDRIREGASTNSDLGLHKIVYVDRARMTIVMVERRDAPIARALREARGWSEPKEG